MVIFYTRDGNGFGANDYWQEDEVVHLATTAGSEKTFPMSELDAKKTAEENAARGVYFTLFNAPLAETGPQLASVPYPPLRVVARHRRMATRARRRHILAQRVKRAAAVWW